MQLVYFPLAFTTGAETPFPDVNNLIGPDVEILGVTAYSDEQLANTPDGATVVPNLEARRLTVTLQKGSDQLFQDVPYTDLIRSENAGIWYAVRPFQIDLTKCTVRANLALSAQFNAAFCFFYALTSER